MMKNVFKKIRFDNIIVIVAAIVGICLAFYFITLFSQERETLLTQAEQRAELDALQTAYGAEAVFTKQYNDFAALALPIAPCKDVDETVNTIMDLYSWDIDDVLIRFFHDGEEYSSISGSEYSNESQSILDQIAAGKTGMIGMTDDAECRFKAFAYYIPVKNGVFADGILALYRCTSALEGMDFSGDESEGDQLPAFRGVISKDGGIISAVNDGTFKDAVSKNLFDYIFNLTESKTTKDMIINGMKSSENGTFRFVSVNTTYIFAFRQIQDYTYSVTIHTSEFALSDAYFARSQRTALTVSLFLFVIFLFICVVIYRKKLILTEGRKGDVDPVLGCKTLSRFEYDATELMEDNKYTQFAVVYFQIYKFSYISENISRDLANLAMRQLNKVLSKFTDKNETYGHIRDDQFVVLFHYRTEQDLGDRIRIIHSLMYNYSEASKYNYNIKITVGIYCVDRSQKIEIQDMLDRAIIAEQKGGNLTIGQSYAIYTENARTSFMKDAEIEAKMEQALVNKEFRVFYQPKYNIPKDKIDGAEALVRWYDVSKNNYISPINFVPLFESDGFIAKLDRYVYEEVCSYLNAATVRGEKIVPISVNVSRVTAIQEDFVDFYVKTKQKYHVGDGFITIEFTESFAFDNYETMKKIILKLKQNGMECSIDDFGSGYSSYNLLKELPMDELKLDSFFIQPGLNSERDDELLYMVINLAKSFGMKVTQEGVETRKDLERIRRMGCDVAQGYLFSKPLMLVDFIKFIESFRKGEYTAPESSEEIQAE